MAKDWALCQVWIQLVRSKLDFKKIEKQIKTSDNSYSAVAQKITHEY